MVCSEGAGDELSCFRCANRVHFECGFGSPINSENWRTFFKRGKYSCPVCVISQSNELVLKCVSINQTHNRDNKATDFALPNGFANRTVHSETPSESGTTIEGQENEEDVEEEEDVVAVEGDGGGDPGTQTGQDDRVESTHGQAPPPQREPEPDNRDVLPARLEPPDPPPDRGRRSPERRGDRPPVGRDRDIFNGLAPVHESDKTRAGRLVYILNTLKNLPGHKTTIIIGDSNYHQIKGDEIDPDKNSVGIRSFGGLCIVAAVIALSQHTRQHRSVRKIVWGLGTNDFLHRAEHCEDDWPRYIKLLEIESQRIFPNAKICFILPCPGIPGVSDESRKELAGKIKSLCPSVKRYYPPSMRNHMGRGVHMNSEGKGKFKSYLQKNFTNIKPGAKPSTLNSDIPNGAGGPIAGGYGYRVPLAQQYFPPQPPQFPGLQPPQYSLPQGQQSTIPGVREISEALAYMLMLHRGGGPQPHAASRRARSRSR